MTTHPAPPTNGHPPDPDHDRDGADGEEEEASLIETAKQTRIQKYTTHSSSSLSLSLSTACFLFVAVLLLVAGLFVSQPLWNPWWPSFDSEQPDPDRPSTSRSSSSSSSDSTSLTDEPIPAVQASHPLINPGVYRYGLSHLFSFTWLHNGEYERVQRYLAANDTRPPYAEYPEMRSKAFTKAEVVNDAVQHFKLSPWYGTLVDYTPQLPNPNPHPLPFAKDWKNTCKTLKIENEWAMCRIPRDKLNEWLPATTHFVTAAVFDAYVDYGTCNGEVPGTVFTTHHTYHFQRWTNSECHNSPITAIHPERKIVHYPEVIDTIGTYLGATGHFMPQQLPRLIRSIMVCPPTAKVIVADGGVATLMTKILIDRGFLTPDRVLVYGGIVYHADVVYRTEAYPYLTDKYNHYAHDRTDMQTVHRALSTDLPIEQRDLVLIIERGGSRALNDQDKLIAYLDTSLGAHPELKLHTAIFVAHGNLTADMELFQRAQVVIGPHGAGMMNVYWVHPGSSVVEIGYDQGMTYPEMYAEMIMHSDMDYYVVIGHGDYGSKIDLDYDDFSWAWNHIMEKLLKQAHGENKEQKDRRTAEKEKEKETPTDNLLKRSRGKPRRGKQQK